ncbi:hypothetical protein L873DRAFT_1813306 [Choiromyces venosus 120613-1]|uniref:Uncharacterized protein n=1 Tax=Choiromyces venosus 120613-1 TaxID=1336337 RepID=A0A3N4JA20_9PEZI|nr:hypothetical protein L873DRAFT_1813306 [Choiromyces venosus 120613-1]
MRVTGLTPVEFTFQSLLIRLTTSFASLFSAAFCLGMDVGDRTARDSGGLTVLPS